MGNTSSHPQQPPLIALNGGSFGRHNNILIPAEAFEDKWEPKRRRAQRRAQYGPNYGNIINSTYQDMWYPRPKVGKGRRAMGGMGPPAGFAPMPGGVAPGMPMVWGPKGVKGAPLRFAAPPGRGAKVRGPGVVQPGVVPGLVPVGGVQGRYPQVCPQAYPQAAGVPFAGAAPVPAPAAGPVPRQAPVQIPVQAQPQAQSPQPRPPPQQPPRPKRHPPGIHQVAAGAHIAQPPLQSPRHRPAEPPISAQLNRAQPPNRHVGLSGQEWIPSSNPFLDACTCTTNCHCRKGARVLYRAQGENDDAQNTWGEIRYINKEDLGRDCGDHSGCRAGGGDNESALGKKRVRGKGKKAGEGVDSMTEELRGLREDIKNMGIRGGGSDAQGGGLQGGMMDGGAGDPYGMPFSPMHMQQPMGGMGGRQGRMPGRGMDAMDLEDEMPFPDADDMMDPMMTPNMMGMRMGLPPQLSKAAMHHLRQRRGRRAKPHRRVPDIDQRYDYAGPQRPPRGANIYGTHPRGGGGSGGPRPRDPDLEEDSMTSGSYGRHRFGPRRSHDEGDWSGAQGMHDDFDIQPRHPRRSPPQGHTSSRGRGSGSRGGGSNGGRGPGGGGEGRRPHQAHVDDGDEY